MAESLITTHVLDLMSGRPAGGVEVRLEIMGEAGEWNETARGRTDSDGRLADLLSGTPLAPTLYRLTFETGDYFRNRGVECFHPYVQIVFRLRDVDRHYHVPLLLSPYGFTTYRGS